MARREVDREALRAIREDAGIEQTALAGRCGITQGHLSNVESGKRAPSPALLRTLADQLGVTLDDISHRAPEPAPQPEPAIA